MADQADDVKPWTIKGIPPEVRNAAIAAAGREKLTIGEWVSRAVRSQVQSDRQQTRSPVVVGPEVRPEADLAEIERLIAATAELAQAAGEPPPKTVTRAAYGLLRSRLTAMKGGPTGARKGPTKEEDGPTEEASSPTAS